MDDDKRERSDTTDGQPPRPGFENAAAPAPIGPSGQHEAYWVLSQEERDKGFVRPVRSAYRHTGRGVCGARVGSGLGEITVCVLPPGHDGDCGDVRRSITAEQLSRLKATGFLGGCGSVTYMGVAIAETYARDLHYYGATFCCHCNEHFPVGEQGEFCWLDGGRDAEKVGT
jgi:hypothetical protein